MVTIRYRLLYVTCDRDYGVFEGQKSCLYIPGLLGV